MQGSLLLAVVLLLLGTTVRCHDTGDHHHHESSTWSQEEIAAEAFLDMVDQQSSEQCHKNVVAQWKYASDITEPNQEDALEAKLEWAKYEKARWKNVTKFDYKNFQDEDMQRQFEFLSVLGTAALPEKRLKKFNQIISDMEVFYSTAKICSYKNPFHCGLNLEPELTSILAKSRDYEELKHVWKEWRDKTGKKIRNHYRIFVQISNEAARLNKFADTAEEWVFPYETKTFHQDVEHLWQQLMPLYQELHAYVRRNLREAYGEDKISKDGPIPAHLLGNMWAQSWGNILDMMQPYPDRPSVDVTQQMIEQGFTPQKMFEISDEFFTSLGLIPMPSEFWKMSIIEKPVNRELVCHASAWDFCNGKDFRIKQCTRVTMEDLITVHHEMGHIEYYLQYKHQKNVYRNGANPGFHEAVGDVLALSVATPKHLKEIGLLEKVVDDYETDINFLFSMALEKIAFLPFGYLMDNYRWAVFSGEVSESDLNCYWWKLREKYQGLKPPVKRTERDFDPGAKYHIAANVPYIRYFVSFVIQFQFHKALCLAANQYEPNNPNKPLHKCDIYRSREAGILLSNMLKMGSSRPWPEAMEAITGQKEMDASAIREYFKPLEDWLKEQNKKTGEYIGWKSDDVYCVRGTFSPKSSAIHEKGHSASSVLSSSIIVITASLLATFWLTCCVDNSF